MAVTLTVLGSGSKGNSTVVCSSNTRILVDAGFSCRETLRRMQQAGLDPYALNAILVSHEHSDHVNGVFVLARKLKIPVFMTSATHEQWWRSVRDRYDGERLAMLETFEAGRAFHIGDVEVMPFTIPHDSVDPVGFAFRAEGVRLGVVTDLGYMPENVKYFVRSCDCLMVESNHDLEMLRSGPYPWAVKQRVLSKKGHLSNDALAEFFATDYDGAAAFLILAHLSEANNHPEIARDAAEKALGGRVGLIQNRILLALQDQPLETVCL
ncbi:MAG TPA: MBL fold metallo-hydrolase [Terriglobales bacterium]|nr:MBL fold metallo-hydrolase [Terriglobales bacterium]